MSTKVKPKRECINWDWVRDVALAAALVALGLGMAPATRPRAGPRAQPVLLEMVTAHPDSNVAIIVQESGTDGGVEELVVRLGGTVTRDLSIINAFAANLPAKAVTELACADGVRWVSLDAPVTQSACDPCIDTSNLKNAYIRAIGADRLWNEPPYLQGQGITVAVVDSGIGRNEPDLQSRVRLSVNFNRASGDAEDRYGHGTHIGGVIAGTGAASNGAYVGVAPGADLISVKVSDSRGAGTTSDVVAGLQWIYEHRQEYNIRIVNLSLNSSVAESYNTSPLDAALEILWFNRIVVVVSAGNSGGRGIHYPPANDPFVITVGAIDDRGTPSKVDDVLASFSPYGKTQDKIAKPDLVAPGTNIVSVLSSTGETLAKDHPDHIVDGEYFRMSGTSMASAVTAGATALLLQSNPGLTPDQVKYRLADTARAFKYKGTRPGYIDIYAAVHSSTTKSANTGQSASRLLWTGDTPVLWGNLHWDSVNWDSVNWDSVNWDSVNWDSVNWDSDSWDD